MQHPYQATDGEELWNLSLDLDDLALLSEGDKLRVRDFVNKAVDEIEKSRLETCAWFNLKCKARNRKRMQ